MCWYLKKFIKGRWFPLSVAVIIALIVIIGMVLFGWRITYAPELENSWEATSAVASIIGAVGTVAAVWFAVLSTEKQIRVSQQQQKQNTGLNLYGERKNALRLFAERKYDEMYWDAVILFSPETTDKILSIGLKANACREYHDLLQLYESEMEISVPELYQEFIQADDDAKLNISNRFSPITYIPWADEKRLLNYRQLIDKEKSLTTEIRVLHQNIFQSMQNEIKISLQ